jgi:hypothetical protein
MTDVMSRISIEAKTPSFAVIIILINEKKKVKNPDGVDLKVSSLRRKKRRLEEREP